MQYILKTNHCTLVSNQLTEFHSNTNIEEHCLVRLKLNVRILLKSVRKKINSPVLFWLDIVSLWLGVLHIHSESTSWHLTVGENMKSESHSEMP